jgi:Transposase
MDGFTGFKTATSEELPDAVAVMDPFHAVRLAGDALDQCRRRVQQATCGRRAAGAAAPQPIGATLLPATVSDADGPDRDLDLAGNLGRMHAGREGRNSS